MVALTIAFVPSVHMTFWGAVFTSFTISLINYLVNLAVPGYNEKRNTE
jgi:predicted CDP-diglyceride synthetase/phosphatidate cytidylyltransferase